MASQSRDSTTAAFVETGILWLKTREGGRGIKREGGATVLVLEMVLSVCVAREARAIKLDGLSVAELKELQEKAEKHAFAAEVDRMMKLIINSLYRNKEVGRWGRGGGDRMYSFWGVGRERMLLQGDL